MWRRERLFNLADVGNVSSTVDDVTDIINSTIMEDSQECEKSVNMTQNINLGHDCSVVAKEVIVGSGSSITQDIVATLLQSCFQDATKMRELTNDITEKIKSYAEKKGISGIELVKIGDTESAVDVQTYLTNEFTASTKQECDSTIGIDQNVKICGERIHMLGTIAQSASVEISGNCDQITSTIEKVANEITKVIDSKAASGENWSDIFDSLGPIVLIGAIVVIMGILAAMLSRGGKKRRPRPGMRPGMRSSMREPLMSSYYGQGEKTKNIEGAGSINLDYDW